MGCVIYCIYMKKHFTVKLLKSIKSVILKSSQWVGVGARFEQGLLDLRESEPLD